MSLDDFGVFMSASASKAQPLERTLMLPLDTIPKAFLCKHKYFYGVETRISLKETRISLKETRLNFVIRFVSRSHTFCTVKSIPPKLPPTHSAMASHDVSVFHPYLFDEDDDIEDVAYKEVINDLITQQTTPAQAAEAIDEWVVREANTKYEQLRQRDPPFYLTPEEKDSVYLVGPNASRHVEMMVGTVAKICSAYPPGHTAQNALIEFFQALKALPRHDVPNLSYEDDSDEPTFDIKLTLWSFGTPSVEYLAQRFQREAEGASCGFDDIRY
jgi:hypothetical protein